MRRTIITLSAVALAATLGACSQESSGTPVSSGQPEQGSNSAPATDRASLVSSSGGSMDEKKSVVMTTETTGGAGASSMGAMECEVDIAKESMSCSSPMMKIITTPDASYINSEQLGGDPATPWMKIDLNANNPMMQTMAQSGSAIKRLTDIKTMLPKGTSIVSSKQEKLNGTDATRYETVTNLEQTMQQMPELKSIFQIMVKSGVKELKQTVWVDSEGLPMKVMSKTPQTTVMGSQVGGSTTTTIFKDWDAPVTVSAPPAGKVQEFKIPEMDVPQLPTPPN